LVLSATAAVAHAQSHEDAVRLQYAAPPQCPDSASFLAQLRERMARGRLAESGELARTFGVSIAADATDFSGRVELVDESGTTVSRRVHGEQCEAVVSSLALITALSLDATLRPEPSEPVGSAPALALPPREPVRPVVARPRVEPSISPRRVTRRTL
jgi:hypothetical protein